jgi:His/Glu/Gln/Arg/opine family amino acid ABC transporter permease subunit
MSPTDVLTIFSGALTTLLLSVAGIALGLPLGLGLALLRWGRVPLANPAVAVYVSLLRATPLVTLVLLLFFALPSAGISMGPVTAGLLALTLNTAAFNCEVWRAALLDLPKDQIEAAQSVGMGRVLRFRRIVLPQIARTALPGLINEMSLLVKLTPVLAVVGVVDITRAAVRIGAQTYEPLPPLLVALAIYIPIVFALVSLQRWLEGRLVRREAAA